MKENYNEWLHSEETKKYLDILNEKNQAAISMILDLTESGQELTKSFYELQGKARAFSSAIEIANELAQEGEKDD